MSSILPTHLSSELKSSARAARWPHWLREPLLHFLLLGALLFTVDWLVFGRADDPRAIVIDAAVDREARDVFSKERGRAPNSEELYALRRVWLDNEVLYREGLAFGLDKGDDVVRQRVIFRMLSVINADLKLPPVDDEVLRAWFEKNRASYDEPARYGFQEAVVAGERSEAAVRALVETLNKGAGGELNAGLRVFKGRPRATIVQAYGDEFTTLLEASRPGEWRAVPARDGWRAVQLESTTPGRPAVYETLRGVVLQDWTDATMAERRTAAVRALAMKYRVKYEEQK